ncbi:MAG: hypothetical protein Q9157_008348 [Trypethelium eluteriae]
MLSTTGKLAQRSTNAHRFWHWKNTGLDVDIYILDTGININHIEFRGRAYNFRNWAISPYIDGELNEMADTDEDSHGTCLASVAGGAHLGPAKYANIINVKVGTGGSTPINYLSILRALKKTHNTKKFSPSARQFFAGSVINMSFGGDANSRAVQLAIWRAKQSGIPIVVAAGNENRDARDIFPCNMTSTVCVAGVDNYYRRDWDSNYGPKIAVSAPGHDIECAAGVYEYGVHSGTSIAAAYVSGVLAYFISYERIRSNTDLVIKRMKDNWNTGLLEGFLVTPETPNTLISNGFQNPDKLDTQPYVGAPNRRAIHR